MRIHASCRGRLCTPWALDACAGASGQQPVCVEALQPSNLVAPGVLATPGDTAAPGNPRTNLKIKNWRRLMQAGAAGGGGRGAAAARVCGLPRRRAAAGRRAAGALASRKAVPGSCYAQQEGVQRVCPEAVRPFLHHCIKGPGPLTGLRRARGASDRRVAGSVVCLGAAAAASRTLGGAAAGAAIATTGKPGARRRSLARTSARPSARPARARAARCWAASRRCGWARPRWPVA